MSAHAIPIHDGQRYFGSISEAKPSFFEAVSPSGKSLGLFNSASAATHALFVAASRQQGR